MSVLANGHAAALFRVERLDPALDEVQNHCLALVERAARRRGQAPPGSWTGRLLRLHRWLPVRVSSISRRLSLPFEDRTTNIITNRGRKRKRNAGVGMQRAVEPGSVIPLRESGFPQALLFLALRFHGKNGWMSAGTLPPAAAQCPKYPRQPFPRIGLPLYALQADLYGRDRRSFTQFESFH